MNIYKKRIDELRKKMKLKNIDYYIVPTTDFHNSEYVGLYFKEREFLSGFTGSNGTLVVSEKEAFVWTDGRYFVQAKEELLGSDIEMKKLNTPGEKSIMEYLRDQISNNKKKSSCIGFFGETMTTKMGMELEKLVKEWNGDLYYKEDVVDGIWSERPNLTCHTITILEERITGVSTTEKIKKIRERMRELGAANHFLTKLDDIMWIFNIRGSDIPTTLSALSYCFFTEKEVYLFVQDCEKQEKLQQMCRENDIILKEYKEVYSSILKLNIKGPILIDSLNCNYYAFKTLEKLGKIIDRENPSQLLKAIKNEVELKHIRETYIKDSAILCKFLYWLDKHKTIKEETEYSLGKYLDQMRLQSKDCLGLSFSTICAYKEHAAMMHYEAKKEGSKKIEDTGMLLIDSGGQYIGGTTDVTRTISIGDVEKEVKRQFSAVVKGMLQLSNAKFIYGCTGRNLDILARKYLWEMQIDYKCGTGHGIGFMGNVHEGPQNIRYGYQKGMEEAVLEEGMLLSNEPGVYMEGSHGIRIENIMAVKTIDKEMEDQFMEFEVLTFVPIDIRLLDQTFFSKEDINLLNHYHEMVYHKIAPYLNSSEKGWLKEVTKSLEII